MGRSNNKKLQSALLVALFASLAVGQLHFVSLGNFGRNGLKPSASTLISKAKAYGIAFLVSPGSNFFNGVIDLNDTKWESSFEMPLKGSSMSLPFFTVLGSEDWKGNYTALPLRTNATRIGHPMVAATDKAPSSSSTTPGSTPLWYLPNWWYHYSTHFSDSTVANAAFTTDSASVGFVFIDTYILSKDFRFPNITKMHWDNLRDTVAAAVNIFDWVIVVGDSAALSSSGSNRYLSTTLRPFLKDFDVDVYLSGSAQNMEAIEDGSLVHINCGAATGGKGAGRKTKGSAVLVTKAGFCHHILYKSHFTTEFVDGVTGRVLGSYTRKVGKRTPNLMTRFHTYKTLPEIHYIPIPVGAGTGEEVEDDLFIRVVGTIGMIILGILFCLSAAIGHHRFVKGAAAEE